MTAQIVRHDSKNTTLDNFCSRLYHSCNNLTLIEFDQTTNYSLRYTEENSVVDEISYFEHISKSNERENTVTTYITEETPFETPLFFSTSTSTSDLLRLDDIKIEDTIIEKSENYNKINGASKKQLEIPKDFSQLKSYMELENKDKECENSNRCIYLPDDSDDEKCDDERIESIINVTPSQSPIDDKDRDDKMVNFGDSDHFTEQTPLMFSRSSSLGSLSGFEQQSICDDHSSIVSDFSFRTSEAVSPSNLPDSPAQLTPGQQKLKKPNKKRTQQSLPKMQTNEPCSSQQEISKHSIFEDDVAVFKEESTPIKLQSVAASSLSSLTIDDDEEGDESGERKNKISVIKSAKLSEKDDTITRIQEGNEDLLEGKSDKATYFYADEEKILDEYIRKGIAKVTKTNVSCVSTPSNYEGDEACDDRIACTCKIDDCQSACQCINSLDLFDEESDLTVEEESLLNEYIRRGIAKVTRQSIEHVSTLSLNKNSPRSKVCGEDFCQVDDVDDDDVEQLRAESAKDDT
ncbi:adenomatous polyposis coli protein-like [Trichogramma pretiosum]|uniref:adenomatous polyposis coli protein-like n=1 Tax=Trichogramma pretiosum TaxID=7493 RepID=UPI0006C9E4CE|nr:adenomatous polyposis coli protein-like [Trichogramma pretiosum]